MSTKVSIIVRVPVWSESALRTVRSAVSQTHPDVETLIVAQGSADRVQIEQQLAPIAQGVRVVLAEDGVAKGRDAGTVQAADDWIVYLEAEETLEPEAVAAWVSHAQAHPEHSLIFSGWYEPKGDSQNENLPHKWTNDPLEGDILETLVRSPDAISNVCLIRKSAVTAIGGHYNKSVSEAGSGWDALLLYYRLLLNGGTFGYVPRALAHLAAPAQIVHDATPSIQAQRVAVLQDAYQRDLPRMVLITDSIARKRRLQFQDAIQAIRARDQHTQQIQREMDAMRDYQKHIETAMQEQNSLVEKELETARAYQKQLESALQEQTRRLEKELSGARDYQARLEHIVNEQRQQIQQVNHDLHATSQKLAEQAAASSAGYEAIPVEGEDTPFEQVDPESAERIAQLEQEVVELKRDQIAQRVLPGIQADRSQQVAALMDHIGTLESALAVYRATNAEDSEGRINELYEKWQAAERELTELKALPAVRLLAKRKPTD